MTHSTVGPSKSKITRAWNDLAPKLLAFLTGGSAATALIFALQAYAGLEIDPSLANVIVVVAGTVLGYFVKDSVPAKV